MVTFLTVRGPAGIHNIGTTSVQLADVAALLLPRDCGRPGGLSYAFNAGQAPWLRFTGDLPLRRAISILVKLSGFRRTRCGLRMIYPWPSVP